MKATLEFDLPDDQWEFNGSTKWHEFYNALKTIQGTIRNYDKSDMPDSETLEVVREIIKGIDLDF